MGNCWSKPEDSLPITHKPPSPETKPIKDRNNNNKISHENDFTGGRGGGGGGGGGQQQREAVGASANYDEGIDNNNNGRIITPNLKMFTFGELRSATRNFRPDTVVGEGGFGRVFKGWVDEKTYAPSRVGVGIPVAVKKSSGVGFKAEVKFLGKFSHPNLVKLLGYCWEDGEFLLVYEYMQKGSLESHLFRKGAETLAWEIRIKIAIGAARGLAFLHTTEKQVIYRDFKAANILLDGEYNAKLRDFGFAKLGPDNGNSHVTTRIVRARYPDASSPVYMATGHLYVKSDVYGFGVVLLEILSGLRVLDLNRPTGEHNLVDWAKPLLPEKRKLRKLMDPRLEGQYPSRGAFQIAELILKCLEPDPKIRPNMEQILDTLETVGKLKVKPKKDSKSNYNQAEQTPNHHRYNRSPLQSMPSVDESQKNDNSKKKIVLSLPCNLSLPNKVVETGSSGTIKRKKLKAKKSAAKLQQDKSDIDVEMNDVNAERNQAQIDKLKDNSSLSSKHKPEGYKILDSAIETLNEKASGFAEMSLDPGIEVGKSGRSLKKKRAKLHAASDDNSSPMEHSIPGGSQKKKRTKKHTNSVCM